MIDSIKFNFFNDNRNDVNKISVKAKKGTILIKRDIDFTIKLFETISSKMEDKKP